MANAIHRTSAHRASGDVHEATDWRAAAWAGVIAGVVFMMAEMMMVWLFLGQSPWGPPRMMAAMALGKEVLPPPADFSLTPMMTAMAIHLPLSAVYGVIIGWLVHRFDMLAAVLMGMVFGVVAIYAVNFYLIAPAMFPWFVEARNWVSLIAHAMFGIVAAAVYVSLRKPPILRAESSTGR